MKIIKFMYDGKCSEFLEVEDNQVEKIVEVRNMVEALTGNKCKIIIDESREL